MRVIVLGANGRIGSHICTALSGRQDMELIPCARGGDKQGFISFDPFRDDWKKLGQADVLINAIGSISNREKVLHRVHVELAEKIICHSAMLGHPRIIQISALGAEAASAIPFLRTKGIADDLLLQHSDTTVLRPSIVCMHGTMMMQKMQLMEQISHFTGGIIFLPEQIKDTRLQPVMVQDIAAVVEALCSGDWGQCTRILPLTGPDVLSLEEIAQMALGEEVKAIRTVSVPAWLMREVVTRLFPSIISRQQYDLLQKDSTADNCLFSRLLGRQPLSTISFWEHCLSQQSEQIMSVPDCSKSA